jgi:hypothetical protein
MKDAAVFFGREEEIRTLWTRIRARPLVAVIGPSGVGKTSFLRAGVVPARPGGWAALVCTPGTTPIRSLGQALGPALAGDPEARPASCRLGGTAQQVAIGPVPIDRLRALHRAARRVPPNGSCRQSQ